MQGSTAVFVQLKIIVHVYYNTWAINTDTGMPILCKEPELSSVEEIFKRHFVFCLDPSELPATNFSDAFRKQNDCEVMEESGSTVCLFYD